MSRYEVDHGDHRFAFGWDEPLRYFFLSVYDKTQIDEGTPKLVFDNLSRPKPGMTVPEIIAKCKEYGWDMPAEWPTKMQYDRTAHLYARKGKPAPASG